MRAAADAVLKAPAAAADRVAMEAYLSKACWRAGTKLVAGLAVIGALVGIRIVTATPAGVEGEIAELERFDAAQDSVDATGSASEEAAALPATGPEDVASDGAVPAGAEPDTSDLDRLVRCFVAGQPQFMRAADCATRGGELEELPPPAPEDGATPPER